MLFRKLIRTMGRYKAQFISMIIMTALGIGVFIGFNMEWYSLELNTAEMFEATGFADYRIVSPAGFSQSDLEAIEALPGVERAARFLSVNTSVKGGGDDMIALTASTDMRVSGVMLIKGGEYSAESENGFWISDRYAAANGFEPGDALTLTYKGLEISGTVEGLVKSGEYLICLPDENQLMPDYNTYGFAYISPKALEKAFGAEFYTQINAVSGMNGPEFIEKAEKALGRTLLVVSKDDSVSWAESRGEIEEGKTMGSILPVLFLAIAILTMVTTMHRLAAAEKTQIGTLKALGFTDRRIILHYSAFALTIGVLGTVFGIGIGYLLGWYIMNPGGAMGTYIDMVSWKLSIPGFCVAVLIGINAFMMLIGYVSVKSMLKGTAADALRPYVPKKIKHLALEKTKLWGRLGFGAQWNLRDSLRHRSRTGMTLFGMIGCMVLLVGALGMNDTLNLFVDRFYHEAINYSYRVNVDTESAGNEQALALAEKLGGDWCAASGVKLGDSSAAVEVYGITHDMVRFTGDDMKNFSIGGEGAYICERLAEENGVSPGDEIEFAPYGGDGKYKVRIAGIIRTLSKSVVMTGEYADRIGYGYVINTVFTNADSIPDDPSVSSVQSKQSIIDSFDTFTELLVTMVFLLVFAAIVLGVVVLYNLGVMSYAERYREMATLKVVGFGDRQIGRILIGQNLWLTVIGVAIGLPCGAGVLAYLLKALASEYEMKLAIGPATYIISVALTFGVSLLVGLLISRKNKRIDMVEALKTPE